jgi:tetratricopeptide (TPR) repeat protein
MRITNSQGFQVGDNNVQVNWLFGDKQPAGPVVGGNVPQAPPAFQPREDLMAQLRKEGPGVPVVRVVTGMRGVGKTQIAAAYARACRDAGWRLIAWVNAEDAVSLLDGLAVAADRLGIEKSGKSLEAVGAEVRNRLEADGDRCLLIFDNVTDFSAVQPYTPSLGDSQVLITSTGARAVGPRKPIQVDVFTEEEALAFLFERTEYHDPDGARAVAEELGYLPLALGQAAGVISVQRLSYPVYLERLRSYPTRRYLPPAGDDPYPRGVAEAILLSVDAVTSMDSTDLCQSLLDVVSLLSPDGVSREILYFAERTGVWAAGVGTTDEALGRLASVSLLTFSGNACIVAMHRLVMRVVRERIAHAEALASLSTGITGMLFGAARSVGRPRDKPYRARELVGHVTGLNDHLASYHSAADSAQLLELRGWALWCIEELGENPDRAVAVGEALVADCERVLGTTHKITLTSRTNLASAYRYAGRLDDAVILCERAYRASKSALGDLDPETLSAKSNLALAYQDVGRLVEAISMHEQEVVESVLVLGESHLHTLRSKNNLALAYRAAGRLGEAIFLYEGVLGECEHLLGKSDPETLMSVSNLAFAYEAAGRLTDAVPLFERAYSESGRVQGEEHQDTYTYGNNLAHAYQDTGRISDAVSLLEKGAAGLERVIGNDHPQTVAARSNLASAYRAVGRLDEAVLLGEKVSADCAQVLGENHPDTLTSRYNNALAYADLGRLDESVSQIERSLADFERVLGKGHPMTARVRRNLEAVRRAADGQGGGRR